MKKIFSFLVALQIACLSLCSIQSNDDSLLVVTIMVKNEASVMAETLQPFLDAGIQSYLILDTGSTDDTVAVTQQLFQDYGVKHGCVVQKPFVDFATSRNDAIEQVEKLFPDSKFIFMIDAEWYVEHVESLVQFCKNNRDMHHKSCLVNIIAGANNYYLQRLFKTHQGVRFEGPVHEVLNQVSTVKVPETKIYYRPRNNGQAKTKERWFRDVSLLLKDTLVRPDNPRTLFYLAQSYDCLGFLDEAAYWYKKRTQAGGWVEEVFMAHYRLAQVYEKLEDWDNAFLHYMKSYALRSTRAEPLIKIAQHYWHSGNHATGFLFAKRACETSYPEADILFIDKYLYDFVRYDVLACCAWYIQEYEIGKQATLEALKHLPDAPHLKRNLALYNSKTDCE